MILRLGAVAALLVAAGALPCPLLIGPVLADTLIDNVEGIAVGPDGRTERLSGLVIGNDGRIVQVLHRGEARPGRVDFMMDGKGRVLLPGLVDGHAEVMTVGFAALTLDLSAAKSLDEAKARIAAYSAAHGDRAWIIGRGWDDAGWGLGRLPGAADLAGLAEGRPVWLVRADGRVGWANAAALGAAGITAGTRDPAGGRIERGAAVKLAARKGAVAVSRPGAPTGALVEAAMGLVERAVPAPRPEDRDLAFAKAQEVFLKRGVTAVSAFGVTIEDWQAFRRAGDAGSLRLRVVGYAAGTEAMSLIGGPGPTPWLYEDRLRLNGVGLVLDGAAVTGFAWAKAPGVTDGGRIGATQLRNLMSRAAIDRFQVAVEAHGDGAVGAVLDAVEELGATYKGDRRWRIEGADTPGADGAARMAALGVTATLMPGGMGAAAGLLRGGVKIGFGSGAGGSGANVFAGLAGVGMPREQVLAGWGDGAARAAMAEGRFGRLAVGQRADFVLLDRDPLMADGAALGETKVLETWVGGRRVWAAEPQH